MGEWSRESDGPIPHPAMNDTVAKLQVRLVPPFVKGGLGGISVCHDHTKSPRPPFRKGGRPEKPLCNSVIYPPAGQRSGSSDCNITPCHDRVRISCV